MTDELPEFPRDAETGMPLVTGTQRPWATAAMIDDTNGEVITETLVFPNFIFFFQFFADVRVGRSIMVSKPYAREFIAALPDLAEQVNAREDRSFVFTLGDTL